MKNPLKMLVIFAWKTNLETLWLFHIQALIEKNMCI